MTAVYNESIVREFLENPGHINTFHSDKEFGVVVMLSQPGNPEAVFRRYADGLVLSAEHCYALHQSAVRLGTFMPCMKHLDDLLRERVRQLGIPLTYLESNEGRPIQNSPAIVEYTAVIRKTLATIASYLAEDPWA